MLSGPRGRAASLEMTSCPGWKKQATSGQRLPCRWCTRCGVNVAHWSTPSRRSRRCSALARCAPRFILMYFLKTCTHTHTHSACLSSTLMSALSCQLVDIQWKLGVAVSSDTCRSLNSPYVSLLLKIVQPPGQICHRSFEMTVPQFQVGGC